MQGLRHTPREIASYLERDLAPLVATGLDVEQAVTVVAMRIDRPAWKVKQMLARYGSAAVGGLSKNHLDRTDGTYPCRACAANVMRGRS